jgi:hypothetical protein
MNDITILIIILIILGAYVLFYKSTSVPTQYKGQEGLDYIRNNRAGDLAQAKALCISQFKGSWVDSSNAIGCYSMQGFSTSYCGMDILKNVIDLCNSIGGNPTCSSTQASCTV